MQSTTHGSSKGPAKSGQPQMMPVVKSTTDDHSGLHDLKALATSTKQRRTQRLSSQMEAQDSLLQSAASLEAVALPDPNKKQAVSLAEVAIGDAPVASIAAATTSMATTSVAQGTAAESFSTIGTPPASKAKYLVFAGVALVAAAAAAFYVMRAGGASDGGESEATTAANALVAPMDQEPAEAAAPVDPEPAAEVAPLVVDEPAAEEGDSEETANDENVVAEATADESEKAPEVKVAAKSERANKKNKEDTPTADKLTKAERKAARAAAKAEAKEKRELAKAAKKAAKAEKKAKTADGAKAPVLGEGGASLDDVLSSVTGGVNKPIIEKVDNTPTKKRLERGDVSKAMKSISSAAKGCYSAEEFSGTVMVKYSVAPSGSMTKAVALGAHKSSKTGKCVVKAVKRAKFPAFSGATQSFTFPFLLSP